MLLYLGQIRTSARDCHWHGRVGYLDRLVRCKHKLWNDGGDEMYWWCTWSSLVVSNNVLFQLIGYWDVLSESEGEIRELAYQLSFPLSTGR